MGAAPGESLPGYDRESLTPEWARPPRPRGWYRLRGRGRHGRLSPFLLVSERREPLVLALMTSTRRRRRIATAVCAALPLALWAGLLLASEVFGAGFVLNRVAGAFVCFWPLVVFLGAAFSSAGATLAERSEATATQLVLTPVRKRAIAASKILPHALPFLLGTAAALPLYTWAGGTDVLLLRGGVPGPQALWPLRLFLGGAAWELEVTPAGCLCAVVMAIGDLAVVWAALHWGAGLAVRLGRLGLVAVYLARNAVLLLPTVAALWAGAFACGALPVVIFDGVTGGSVHGMAVFFGGLAGGGIFVLVWWVLLSFWPVDGAIAEFERFDRLADENFRPELRRGFNPRRLREHIRTRRH